MTPSQTSSALRRIAAKLEGSKNPDRSFVSRDIRRVLLSMDTADGHKLVVGTVEAKVSGTLDGKPFEATLAWEPGTGDPADYNGPEEVNATDLLEAITW